MSKNPDKNTTITIKFRELLKYKELRKTVNDRFKERYGVVEAFHMSAFFGVVMLYVERNLEPLIDMLINPEVDVKRDPAFTWNESKTEAK